MRIPIAAAPWSMCLSIWMKNFTCAFSRYPAISNWKILTNPNARLRYIRRIDMEERRMIARSDHLKIVESLEQRDANTAYEAISEHIMRRREEAVEAVRRTYSELYVPDKSR